MAAKSWLIAAPLTLLLAAPGVTMLDMAVRARAQGVDDRPAPMALLKAWQACVDTDAADRSIGACTSLIEEGGQSRENLSILYYNRGTAYFTKNEFDQAIIDFGVAIALAPDDAAAAYYNRALAYEQLGNLDLAVADFTNVVRQTPEDADAYLNRGWIYHSEGDFDRAISDFDTVLRLRPDDSLAHYQRGIAYFSIGDMERAFADYDRAIALDPGFPMAHSGRALVHLSRDDFEAAVADFGTAIALNPNDAVAYFGRGNAYHEKGDTDRAISDFNKAINLEPDYAGAYVDRGRSYRDDGQLDRAIVDFNMAIKLDQGGDNYDAYEAYTNRGDTYAEMGDFDSAIDDFNTAIALRPDLGRAYFGRGIVYEGQGNPTQALLDFRAAAQLMPAADPLQDDVLAAIAETEAALAPGGRSPTVEDNPSPQLPNSTVVSTHGGAVVRMSSLEVEGEDIDLITLEGALEPGDNESFARAAVTTDRALVSLISPGGDLQAGIEIGKTIWLKEFSTVVPGGAICTSACALAWLAGRPRYIAPGALIGFHAPRRADDPDRLADSAGSALIGGYLSQLGLTASAIAYINEMAPDEMRWLSFADADELGIHVKEFRPEP